MGGPSWGACEPSKPLPASPGNPHRMSLPRDDGHVHLADYVPPAWRILQADLEFDLDPDATYREMHERFLPVPYEPGYFVSLDGATPAASAAPSTTKAAP